MNFLAGAVASLPIKLYRTEGDKSIEVKDDYRLRLLNSETGDLLDAAQWKATIVRDYLLAGNGYTYVHWYNREGVFDSKIHGLFYIDPTQLAAELGTDPVFKTVSFLVNGQRYYNFQIMRVLRHTRDGATGVGAVAENPLHMETMLNALRYENRMVRTGAKKGFLKTDRRVEQSVLDQLKRGFRNLYSNDDEENVLVLNNGLDFKEAGQSAVDTQLNENKETNAHEIYRIFNIVPPVLEGKATEEDLKNTVRFAIKPIVTDLQTAINRFLLLEAEKDELSFEIDMDALDGTDLLARYQAYEVAVKNGWMQPDEIRYEEGRNPLGLKFIRLGLDTVLYDPESGMIYTPNTNEQIKLAGKGGGVQIAGRNQS